ncbi:MAG: tRNA lysidine(34) synthetase TilS, partial [Clostridiales bacterium]|nr:tRNA lysidine(34) synthetase TilS [Clostridiales bacterium]
MALLALLLPYARAGKLQLCVLNVDHCLRKNSAQDSAFVQDFCRRNNIEYFGTRIDIPAKCALSGRGAECEAHFARRVFFTESVKAGRCALVATAHHARDNAETVLLHLFRGCGIKGLAGMEVCSPDGLFRPLLTAEKEEISAFVAEHKIPFVTDETNANTEYDRNYIRHALLPAIRARFPAAERAICRTAQFAREAYDSEKAGLDPAAFGWRGNAVILREEYASAPYIFAALAKLGQTQDVYATAIDRALSLKNGKPCSRASLGGGVIAARAYGEIAFYRTEDYAKETGEIPFALPESAAPVKVRMCASVRIERVNAPRFPAEEGALYLDADKVPAQSVWRTRRAGDRFAPYGGGSKKLKEYFIDRKVPLRERDGVPLLCCDNEALVIAGYEISERVKVDETSKNILCVRICAEEQPCGE